MTTQTEALKLALKAMKSFQEGTGGLYKGEFDEEIKTCEEALAQLEQKRPQNCGTSICSCIECVMEPDYKALWEQMCERCDELDKKLAQLEQEPVTVLPDGSAFAVMSYPLPKDHWLYAERQYECGADEPNELGKPILTHALCDAVVSAVRYAIRGATNCGKENDFDPDALVQNAVYALCGPYGSIQSKEPEQEPNSTTSMSPTSPKALQPEQEPVAHFGSAYVNENGVHVTTVLGPVAIPQDAKLYTTPPQRKPLTDEQIDFLNFLYGAGEWDGVWFEGKHPTKKGAFWWREDMKRLFDYNNKEK